MPDTKPEEIMALSEDQLLAILKNPDAPLVDKAQACERLAVVGGKDAVPYPTRSSRITGALACSRTRIHLWTRRSVAPWRS